MDIVGENLKSVGVDQSALKFDWNTWLKIQMPPAKWRLVCRSLNELLHPMQPASSNANFMDRILIGFHCHGSPLIISYIDLNLIENW